MNWIKIHLLFSFVNYDFLFLSFLHSFLPSPFLYTIPFVSFYWPSGRSFFPALFLSQFLLPFFTSSFVLSLARPSLTPISFLLSFSTLFSIPLYICLLHLLSVSCTFIPFPDKFYFPFSSNFTIFISLAAHLFALYQIFTILLPLIALPVYSHLFNLLYLCFSPIYLFTFCLSFYYLRLGNLDILFLPSVFFISN